MSGPSCSSLRCANPARYTVAHRQYPTTIYSDEGVRTLPDSAVYVVCGVHLRVVKRRYPKALVTAMIGQGLTP